MINPCATNLNPISTYRVLLHQFGKPQADNVLDAKVWRRVEPDELVPTAEDHQPVIVMEILLFETDAGIRRELREQLENLGCRVTAFTTPEPALQHFVRTAPSLVICEGANPDSPGLSLCREIRAVSPGLQPQILLRVPSDDSAGVATLSADVDDFLATPLSPADLRLRLRLAARRHQEAGTGWVAEREPASPSAPVPRDSVPHRLAEAIRDQRIEAYYQPIVSAQTRKPVGFEALARWREPDWGWVPPNQFLPLAEADGSVVEIGRQIISQAVCQLARWRAAGHPLSVSINVSKQQLQDERLRPELLSHAQSTGLPPESLILEVTERHSILHDPGCARTLSALADAGFPLSLDDFGAGYSSFEMIEELPFRELKIDMSLGRKATTLKGRGILEAIAGMGNALGLETVLEGVETDALAQVGKEVGMQRLQGYLFSPPLPPEAILDWLAR